MTKCSNIYEDLKLLMSIHVYSNQSIKKIEFPNGILYQNTVCDQ